MNALTVFTSEIRQLDGLYSLNDLHKAAGGSRKHQPSNFMRMDTTIALIEEIKSSDLRSIPFQSMPGRKGGTYVCRELVYAYAMWISPKFHLAVIRAFDAASMQSAKPEDPGFALMQGGDRAHQRYLVQFEADGQSYRAQPIPAEAYVMTPQQALKALTDGDAPLTTVELFSLIEAAQGRLKLRLSIQEGHSRPFAQTLPSTTG